MLLSFLLPLALCATSTLAQMSPDIQKLYEAAKKEGNTPFRVFAGGDKGSHDIAAEWKAQFPGIPIQVTIDVSKYLEARIERGYAEKRPVADAVIAQTVQDFPRWKKLGYLVPYKFPNFNRLTDWGKDPEGYYFPTSYNGFGTLVFDKEKCPNQTIPKDHYASFAKPEWKGKLVLTYPNDDDAIGYLFAKTVQRLGYEWFDQLAANDVQWVRGTFTPTDKIGKAHGDKNNKRCLSWTAGKGTDQWWGETSPGDQEKDTMFWLQTAALLKGSKRPKTQELFANWITAGATTIFKENYEKKEGQGPQWPERTTKGFYSYMSDRATAERWRFFFEDKIGTPQGPSPLVLYPDHPDSPNN